VRTTQQLSITLPTEMARAVERMVESGAYASASEVIREGVRALLERDHVVEHWLRDEVVKSCEEMAADPAKGIAIEEVLPRLKARLAKSRAG
jgi:antitoxin ParD1/3/4